MGHLSLFLLYHVILQYHVSLFLISVLFLSAYTPTAVYSAYQEVAIIKQQFANNMHIRATHLHTYTTVKYCVAKCICMIVHMYVCDTYTVYTYICTIM